jgi:hypothetical protein
MDKTYANGGIEAVPHVLPSLHIKGQCKLGLRLQKPAWSAHPSVVNGAIYTCVSNDTARW